MSTESILNLIINNAVVILAAAIGAFATIRSVQKTIRNQENQRQEDNKKNALPMIKIDTSVKLSSSNYNELNVKQKTKLTPKEQKPFHINKLLEIPIRNVGLREMYNVRAVFCANDNFEKSSKPQDITPIIYKDDSSCMAINIITYMPKSIDKSPVEFVSDSHVSRLATKLSFIILFDDCFNNSYQQKFAVDLTYDYLKITDGRGSGLYKDFENSELIDYEVLSAPKIIEKTNP